MLPGAAAATFRTELYPACAARPLAAERPLRGSIRWRVRRVRCEYLGVNESSPAWSAAAVLASPESAVAGRIDDIAATKIVSRKNNGNLIRWFIWIGPFLSH